MNLSLMTTQSTALILGLAPAAALATDLLSIAWLVFLGTAKSSAPPGSRTLSWLCEGLLTLYSRPMIPNTFPGGPDSSQCANNWCPPGESEKESAKEAKCV